MYQKEIYQKKEELGNQQNIQKKNIQMEKKIIKKQIINLNDKAELLTMSKATLKGTLSFKN